MHTYIDLSTGEHDPGRPLPVARSSVMWVVRWDYDDETETVESQLRRLADTAPAGSVTALTVAGWEDPQDTPPPVDLLVELAPRLTGLRELRLGDMSSEECELSWITHTDVTPLLAAYPGLRVLRVQGSEGLALSPVRHTNLVELEICTANLPAAVVRAIGGSDLPALRSLELWLGPEFRTDVTVADLAPVLSGAGLPALRHLGICNAEIVDEVAAALAAAPVVARLESLALSGGTLTDRGAEALLAGQPLTHLRRLDLHHHWLSAEMMDRLRAELPGELDLSRGEAEDPDPDDEDDDESDRYVAVWE